MLALPRLAHECLFLEQSAACHITCACLKVDLRISNFLLTSDGCSFRHKFSTADPLRILFSNFTSKSKVKPRNSRLLCQCTHNSHMLVQNHAHYFELRPIRSRLNFILKLTALSWVISYNSAKLRNPNFSHFATIHSFHRWRQNCKIRLKSLVQWYIFNHITVKHMRQTDIHQYIRIQVTGNISIPGHCSRPCQILCMTLKCSRFLTRWWGCFGANDRRQSRVISTMTTTRPLLIDTSIESVKQHESTTLKISSQQ